MVTSLEEATHPSAVMQLASTASFVSGTSYLHGGRVEVTGQQPDEAAAVVRGTLPYAVRLWLDRGRLRWSCSCPAAEDGSFCKHCVAVALHLQPEGTDPFAVAMGVDSGDDPDEAMLAEHVDSLDHDQLAALVLEAADNDWRLRERLLLEARSQAGEAPDAQVWRDRLDIVFAADGEWVTWHETGEWAADIEQVLDGIDDLLHDGHAAMVIELTEHAYRLAEASREYVHHDSPAPADLAMRTRDLHLQACEAARPDAVDLARRLVALELDFEFDDFSRAAADYAEVLGADGLVEYRRQLDARAASGASGSDQWVLHHRIEQARIGIALASGDPDAVIAAHGEEPSARAEVEIVRLLLRSGRVEDAEQRARAALGRLANRAWQLGELRDLLAELLRRRGADQEALELYVEGFLAGPSVSSYRKLLEEAGASTTATGDRAVAALEDLVRSTTDSSFAPGVQPAEALVRVLAHRGEVERAWEAATEHGCSRDMWLTLAHAREDMQPLDAIEVYRREALAQIEAPKNHRYERAVELLGRVRRLAEEAGDSELFEQLLQQIRDEHGRKRNLTKLLNGEGW